MSASRAALYAAACALLICLAACGGSSHRAARPTHPPAGHSPASAQLTVAQARGIFAVFLPTFNQLSTDPSLASQLTTGPETAVETFAGGNAGPAPGTLTGERFLVPYLTSYPRWFLAAGPASSQQGFLFVMVQVSAGAEWREAAEIYDLSQPPQILPDLAFEGFTASGYANPVPVGDGSLTTEPSALSAAYARYLNEGGRGAQGRSFLPGGYTTGYVRLDNQTAASAPALGWHFRDRQSAANLPAYALQLPGGAGALVIFYTKDTVSWTAMSSSASIPRSATASDDMPPLQFLHRLGITAARPGLRVTATAIDENLAFVGPAGAKGTTIVVNDGRALEVAKS
jgi:hypothetical protein